MRKVHFIAIGGSAMHNLALALAHQGIEVTGSDDVIFEPSKTRLAQQGILPAEMGWFPERLSPDLDAVILGMHAKPDNPELLRAQEMGLQVLSYPEYIYQHAQHKTRVVIAGSHGKTTITSMVLHVLHQCCMEVDYLVGAQLPGFDRMVHLTTDNAFMLIEGDEYLSSPIDRRPKFHWYQANIALISGIAWDHINVFPTQDSYDDQFRQFIDLMVPGGSLVYCLEDTKVATMVEQTERHLKKIPYTLPNHEVVDGVTYLETPEGMMPLSVFGPHNLSNLAGARWVCQLMGVDELDFYNAISSFKGAAKRLELVKRQGTGFVYKDFAHAPSKVLATTAAVRAQFPNHRLVVALELHTYSSLNPAFLPQYRDSLAGADQAVVFYDPEALAIKRMDEVAPQAVADAFGHPGLLVFTTPKQVAELFYSINIENTVVLMMSSGHFGGLDLSLIGSNY